MPTGFISVVAAGFYFVVSFHIPYYCLRTRLVDLCEGVDVRGFENAIVDFDGCFYCRYYLARSIGRRWRFSCRLKPNEIVTCIAEGGEEQGGKEIDVLGDVSSRPTFL